MIFQQLVLGENLLNMIKHKVNRGHVESFNSVINFAHDSELQINGGTKVTIAIKYTTAHISVRLVVLTSNTKLKNQV